MASVNVTVKTVTVDTTRYILTEDKGAKRVSIKFIGLPGTLVLWVGEAYDAAGDYTQAQIDARIAELLGSDPAAALAAVAASSPLS